MNKFVVGLIFIFCSSSFFSQESKLRVKHFNLVKTVAIQGYDPVAYFVSKKAIKGLSSIYTIHDGVKYNFSSMANKNLFIKNPIKYEPQFGGWCAFAMGDSGNKVEIDPATFKIVDGKLYLFYNAYFNNTLTSWNKDEASLKKKATANWAKLYK